MNGKVNSVGHKKVRRGRDNVERDVLLVRSSEESKRISEHKQQACTRLTQALSKVCGVKKRRGRSTRFQKLNYTDLLSRDAATYKAMSQKMKKKLREQGSV